ncbi:Sua5 YciO YrdC YwlC family protein [Malaciobacter mytili]|uniref:Sua5 YciO YrdC YwlC family protein n=1 Tax=Malaciobacter mytili LMG 24559 TaxID=1032238 RepID=A0AAX2AB19_9BACT|nr:Sua5 YciO YrdC YwlC family protein [Malaciobacter mytili]AXH14881.1 threonylcarbamoyl-AMP synthase TsaC [Malaciobacter mytili LMG 24559]RXI48022.1 Sua5 YciO YrdC YwlC family protein [Malaciobacter mytili]RXK12004.1 Sua5 YciO YrdC YwlC family protein [Malaciobacter mytili LMG 24559]
MNCELVYLVQTDTTVGFSSTNDEKLSNLKKRPTTQKILQVVDSFTTLKQYTRVPKNHKKLVRKARKTTFIYPNTHSFRIISKEDKFYDFVRKFKNIYSTSANITTKSFDEEFARTNANIIVETKEGFSETVSSSIYLLKKKKLKKIR